MRISDWSSDVCSSDLVTGTDTGAGKTTASAALLHALRARGLHAVGMKPLASGCERDGEGRWRNDDALALQAASDPRPEIGRAACRERVGQCGEISVVAVA